MAKVNNNGETCFGNTEPFVCDICSEDSIRMFELDGIQICKACWTKEQYLNEKLDR